MLRGSLDTTHVSNQQCLGLTGVEMTPAPLPIVIARTGLVVLGTMQLVAAVLYDCLHFVVSQRELN